MLKRKMNKKGDFENILFLVVMIFAVSIVFLVIGYSASQALPRINTALTSSTPVETDKNITKMLDTTESAIYNFNLWFPFLLLGIITFIIIMAFYTESHPIFFFIGIIVLVIALIVGGIYSNVYERISDQPQFIATADNFDISQ